MVRSAAVGAGVEELARGSVAGEVAVEIATRF